MTTTEGPPAAYEHFLPSIEEWLKEIVDRGQGYLYIGFDTDLASLIDLARAEIVALGVGIDPYQIEVRLSSSRQLRVTVTGRAPLPGGGPSA